MADIQPQTGRPSTQDFHVQVEKYTVGWICAIPAELEAARDMLDEKHPRLKSQPKHDNNNYSLGRINDHYVCIACLPEYGTKYAAIAASSMQSTFPNLRFGLMVGIGGGVPSKNYDMRLGDIVVSLPTDQGGGVIQYDLGRKGLSRFERVGVLNKPPILLRAAVNTLRAIKKLDVEIETILKTTSEEWTYPTELKDVLFETEYKNLVTGTTLNLTAIVSGLILYDLVYFLKLPLWVSSVVAFVVASICIILLLYESSAREAIRPPRKSTRPVIHYGNIGSGNTVMKNGFERDAIAKRDNVICFEMEAAGLMDHFPCLVIRGISDYSDSNKNWQWEPYAAATAAAFAKRLLMEIGSEAVEDLKPIRNILEHLSENLMQQRHEEEQEAIVNWLTPVTYDYQQSNFLAIRQEKTGEWLVQSTEFQDWIGKGDVHTLFCPGMPGAGKTIVTATVIDYLFKKFQEDSNIGIAYLYGNSRKDRYEQDPAGLLLSILKQLVQHKQPPVPASVKKLYTYHKVKRTRPTLKDFTKALQSVISSFARVYIIVDALDEYRLSDGDRKLFIEWLFELQQPNRDIRIFVSSRSIPRIKEAFAGGNGKIKSLEIRASEHDIQLYLNARIAKLPLSAWNRPDLEDEVRRTIIGEAKGMFLLAKLFLDSLEDKINAGQVKHALKELPSRSDAYTKAYTRVMERIKDQRKGFQHIAFQALTWITCTNRDMTTAELQHALAIEVGSSKLDENHITTVESILSVCAGLLVVDEKDQTIKLFHSTAQEYFKQHWKTWFPNAHAEITQRCVTYLLYDDFDTGFCETDQDFEERSELHSLYTYAAQNWGHHARTLSNENNEPLILELLQCQSKLFACTQAMLIPDKLPDYSQRTAKQMTGLHLAAYFGLDQYVTALIWAPEDCELRDGSNRTALHWATDSGHDSVVKLLLEKGSTLSSQDQDGRTALHLAADKGHKSVVELLVKASGQSTDAGNQAMRIHQGGLNLESQDRDGQTAMHLASKSGHESVVELLISAGASEQPVDNDNHTALHCAAENGQRNIIQILLSNGASINPKERYGQTPLHYAVKNGNLEAVQLLLDKGADLESQDEYMQTPLLLASTMGHAAVVDLLLNKGAELQCKDRANWTPLHRASLGGYQSVVKILLGYSPAVEPQDEENRTPLHWAALGGHEFVVRLLLEVGAQVRSMDSEKRTPLDLAVEMGHLSVATLLRQHID